MVQKTFKELNLSNAFLFSAAMEDSETCQLALECILGRKIRNVKVKTEYNVLYNSDFKSIRLDVWGQDELNVSYDLEMQNKDEKNLPKRSRYYQAEVDVASLKSGEDYEQLKPLYIIFICNFDPFGEKLCCYTFEMQCKEKTFPLNDGVQRIFLNIKGENKEEISGALREFLGYLNDSTEQYIEKIKDGRVKRIHEKVKALKMERSLEARYMYFEELLQDSYKDGHQEGLQEGLRKGHQEGLQEGLREGHQKTLEASLKALIHILCEFLPDEEAVYQNIISNDIYSQITREQFEICYREVTVKSENKSNNK